MMEEFGVHVHFSDNIIKINPQTYRPIRYRVESDWSAASYWYEILSFSKGGEIRLNGLNKNSLQGDKAVAEIYQEFGIKTDYFDNYVIISKSNNSTHQADASTLKLDFKNTQFIKPL